MYFGVNKILKIAIWIIVIVCAWLVLLRFLGFGSVNIQVPAGVNTTINGSKISSNQIKLRPGTYNLAFYSPAYFDLNETIKVHLFARQTIRPDLKKRSEISILVSNIGSSGLYGKPTFTNTKWLDGNNWLVGVVGPGSASIIALQYSNHRWQTAYYDGSTDKQNLNSLPADVKTSVMVLKDKYERS